MRRLSMLVPLLLAALSAAASAQETPMVFFGYQESSLSASATEVLGEAVKNFRADGYSRGVVVGYCDAAEMVKDCPALAQHRADAVKAELVRLGIDAGVIDARMSTELLTPTAAGLREPLNRRAVIDFSGSPK